MCDLYLKDTEHHLELLEGFLTVLLNKKWKNYARFRFYFQNMIFLLFWLLIALTINLRWSYYLWMKTNTGCIENSEHEGNFFIHNHTCECSFLYPLDDGASRYVRYNRHLFLK